MRILIVEDDETQGAAIMRRLKDAQFTCDWVRSVAEGTDAVRAYPFDLVVLDRQLPDGDGLQIVRDAQVAKTDMRFLILSTMGDSAVRTLGLSAGADDYLAKPFDFDEMLARVRALLRRSKTVQPNILKLGRLELRLADAHIVCGRHTLLLPRREYVILETLMLRAERVTTRQTLEDAVYTMDEAVESNTLDAQISRLRRKLRDVESGLSIVALRGIGYLLTARKEHS